MTEDGTANYKIKYVDKKWWEDVEELELKFDTKQAVGSKQSEVVLLEEKYDFSRESQEHDPNDRLKCIKKSKDESGINFGDAYCVSPEDLRKIFSKRHTLYTHIFKNNYSIAVNILRAFKIPVEDDVFTNVSTDKYVVQFCYKFLYLFFDIISGSIDKDEKTGKKKADEEGIYSEIIKMMANNEDNKNKSVIIEIADIYNKQDLTLKTVGVSMIPILLGYLEHDLTDMFKNYVAIRYSKYYKLAEKVELLLNNVGNTNMLLGGVMRYEDIDWVLNNVKIHFDGILRYLEKEGKGKQSNTMKLNIVEESYCSLYALYLAWGNEVYINAMDNISGSVFQEYQELNRELLTKLDTLSNPNGYIRAFTDEEFEDKKLRDKKINGDIDFVYDNYQELVPEGMGKDKRTWARLFEETERLCMFVFRREISIRIFFGYLIICFAMDNLYRDERNTGVFLFDGKGLKSRTHNMSKIFGKNNLTDIGKIGVPIFRKVDKKKVREGGKSETFLYTESLLANSRISQQSPDIGIADRAFMNIANKLLMFSDDRNTMRQELIFDISLTYRKICSMIYNSKDWLVRNDYVLLYMEDSLVYYFKWALDVSRGNALRLMGLYAGKSFRPD